MQGTEKRGNKTMWRIKQAGQDKLGERGCRELVENGLGAQKGYERAALPQTACLRQETTLADVPLRFWALNSTGVRCRSAFNDLIF